ncbi:TetR/AcrR family transcriptional regulator [Microbacterium sp. P05]|uniref:TetR/AcrR family transcriptional regulator n=1 Tax=Microbacterium sp. P05 TaxID=3366948 RepID=UPI003746FE84
MPSTRYADQNRLAVSGRVTLAFLSEGYATPVARICERAGVAERTFYRYFPTKAEAIRPVLEHGIDLVAAELRENEGGELEEVLVAAFARSLWGERGVTTARLVPLILAEPALYAVWLSTIRAFEAALGQAIQPWLRRPVSDLERHVIAGVLVTAMRISFEESAVEGADAVNVYRSALTAVDLPALLWGRSAGKE